MTTADFSECPGGCGVVRRQVHCDSKHCTWVFCPPCDIDYDPRTGKFIPHRFISFKEKGAQQ